MLVKRPVLSIIVAATPEGVIGVDGGLPWKKLPNDMQQFKKITDGHPVIMGRKTWESIPEKFRPLPGRTNIVVTRQKNYQAEGAIVAASLLEAKIMATHAPGREEFFVIGGGELYCEAIHLAQKIYFTLVHASISGDAHFPKMRDREWRRVDSSYKELRPGDEYPTTFKEFERICIQQ